MFCVYFGDAESDCWKGSHRCGVDFVFVRFVDMICSLYHFLGVASFLCGSSRATYKKLYISAICMIIICSY